MTQQTHLSPRAWAELLLLSLVWGASFLAFAIGLEELPVYTLVAWRVGLGALTLWVLVPILRIPLPRKLGDWARCGVMGLLNNAIPFSLIAWGQQSIESGLASIFNAATAIIAVPLVALFFVDERLTLPRTTGTVLGFVAVILIIGPDALSTFDLRAMGQIAILGAATSYAFASIWARKTIGHLDPRSAALGMLTGSTVLMIPLALVVDGAPSLDLNPSTWTAVGYLAVAATAGAYLLYYRVLKMAGAANLMLSTLLVAPVAIILGAVTLGETLPPRAYIGFALLALGLLMVGGQLQRIFPSRR